MKRPCHECGALVRAHADWCVSRGYTSVGPHPDAPDTERAPAPSTAQCPCGRARAGCDYHDPALQPVVERPSYEVYDVEDLVLTFNGVKLVDGAVCGTLKV